jgi:ankyrin repeat protein
MLGRLYENPAPVSDTEFIYAAEEGGEAGLDKVTRYIAQNCIITISRLRDHHGHTALIVASIAGHEPIVNALLALDKIDINATDLYGFTALNAAASYGHEKVVKALLATQRAFISATDKTGTSALISAASWGFEPIVKLLLEEVSLEDLLHKNQAGYNAAQMAEMYGFTVIAAQINDRIEALKANAESPLITVNDGYDICIRENLPTPGTELPTTTLIMPDGAYQLDHNKAYKQVLDAKQLSQLSSAAYLEDEVTLFRETHKGHARMSISFGLSAKQRSELDTALFKKLLSDHMPFLVKNEKVSLISWNILTKMRFNATHHAYNNGFLCKAESDDHYSNRLLHIATKLSAAAKQEKPAFICLQECPDTHSQAILLDHLSKKIAPDYQPIVPRSNSAGYDLITLYDTQHYSLEEKLSDEISHLPLSQGLNGKILPLVFTSHQTKESLLVVNVHANFAQDVLTDVKTIYARALELGINDVILLGDFNRDLLLASDHYSKHDICHAINDSKLLLEKLHVNTTPNASFCAVYNEDNKSQLLETRDGTISTFPADITVMAATNVPDIALSYHYDIAPQLSFVPKTILAALTSTRVEGSYRVKR